MGASRNEFACTSGSGEPRRPYLPQGEGDYERIALIESDLPDSEKWLDVRGVELYLRISKRTVYRLVERGEVPYIRIGRRYRFNKRDLDVALDAPGLQ